MRAARLGLLLAAAVLGACGSDSTVRPAPAAPGPGGDPGAGEPAGLASITAAHNAVRARVGVGPLTWDSGLAATAAAWAAGCRDVELPTGLIDHNPDRSAGSPVYVGENIYASTAALEQVTGPQAVAAWAAEESAYDHGSNTCATGQVCGHYTQVVWRNTTRVGCAKVRCAALEFPTTIVCDYAPGGNAAGERPY